MKNFYEINRALWAKKKIFTILMSMLTISAFAATEQAWYNDVTSITANGQYYIYSVNGKGFMQANKSTVQSITTSNYTNVSTFKFKITKAEDGNVINGDYYLKSYRAALGSSNSGPVCTNNSDDGTTIIWTNMANGSYWNIHGHYDSFGNRCACLKYQGNKYDGYIPSGSILNGGFSITKDPQTDTEYRWYLVSQAQLDRHFAIYFFDAYKEGCNIAQYENHVPAAYYTALQTAYNKTFSVQNAAHSADVVNAAKAELETLYTGAPAIKIAYETAKGKIDALEAVEDKGEDFAEVTNDITNARTELEAAMTVEAVEASVAGLKSIDPITFNVTEFVALTSVSNAAASEAGREISYAAENTTIINDGKAIYAGTTKLIATAVATDEYYKFVRSAQVTVTAWDTESDFERTTCDEAVEFNGQNYDASFADDVNVGKNYIGGDSIVHVNITINHSNTGTDTKTITVGDDEIWNSIALKDSTVGVHTVVTTLTNVAGCDSTVTLTLTVNKIATLEKDEPLVFCANDSAQFRGKWYFKAEDSENISAEGATRDTLYKVMVTVLDTNMVSEQKTITEGDDVEWNYIALKDSAAGTYTIVYETTNIAGCDSTVTLTLTVKAKENQGGTTGLENIQRSDVDVQKFFRNGVMYIRRGETLYGLDGKRVG